MSTQLKNALRDLIIFWIFIVMLSFFWKNTIATACIIIAIYLVRAYFWKKKGDVALYITGFILGTAAELFGTSMGVWQYAQTDFLNVPLWLPFAWGVALVLMYRIAQNFIKD